MSSEASIEPADGRVGLAKLLAYLYGETERRCVSKLKTGDGMRDPWRAPIIDCQVDASDSARVARVQRLPHAGCSRYLESGSHSCRTIIAASLASTWQSIIGAGHGSRIPFLTHRRSVSPWRCARSLAKPTRHIGGLIDASELIYIVAEVQRNVIRLRTNYRNGQDIYLYRTTVSPATGAPNVSLSTSIR